MRLLTILFLLVILFSTNEGKDGEKKKAFDSIKNKLSKLGDNIDNKMDQLKALKLEIRNMNQELRRQKVTIRTSLNTTESSVIQDKRSWKKKVRNRIRGMQKKLSKLEKAIQEQKQTVKELNKKSKMYRKRNKKEKVKVKTLETTRTSFIEAFEVQRNKSRPGEHDSPCGSHNECKPGHCCHRKAASEGRCVKHVFKSGEVCRDSCSCENHLHCFLEKNTNTTDNAYCKEARAEDFQNGTYKNAKHDLFNDS